MIRFIATESAFSTSRFSITVIRSKVSMKIGVHGKQAHELVQPLVHVAVELRERRQVVPDLRLLLAALLEQPLGDHELHVRSGDEKLIVAILHAAQTVSHVGESEAVEERLLHAGYESESGGPCRLRPPRAGSSDQAPAPGLCGS